MIALGVPATAAVAQERQPSPKAPPVFSTETAIVNVVVSVRDGDGKLVSDLEPSDFVVQEDGREQRIAYFARAATDDVADARERLALDLGLLLDTSESMKAHIRLAQDAAIRFLDTIPRARDLLMLFFDQDIRLSRYDSEHQQGLFERILDSKGGGYTALYDAVTVYLSRIEDSEGRKVLVLFTDGADSISDTSLGDVINMVRSSTVTIYPISFAENLPSADKTAARSCLAQLAEASGGTVFTPLNARDFRGIFQKILDEISAQYVIGFSSDSTKDEGRFRKLKVTVKRPGCKTRHRPGYVVPVEKRASN
jgi:Ca-activated chloride channel family protein